MKNRVPAPYTKAKLKISKSCNWKQNVMRHTFATMLARIGSPLASVDTAAKAGGEISVSDIAEFIYVHAAPLDEVRQTVYRSRSELAEKADAFCAAIPPYKIPAILSALAEDAQAVRLAQASALPDSSLPPSRNGQSPAE